MNVLIVDYGMGNIGSVRRVIQECGANPIITQYPEDIDKANKIILPGVGAFPDGMLSLNKTGWVDVLRKAILEDGKSIFGICLGMQLLATVGYEGHETSGLDLIGGVVEPLKADADDVRIPHVGWNEIEFHRNDPLIEGVAQGTDCYFVHSYHFTPKDDDYILATTPYCGQFVSIVRKESVYGTQFHPEKSSKAGLRIIENFLKI
jgi:glutamine amidotransferase